MFLSSVRVPSRSSPRSRTETLASQRSWPFSMSASEISSQRTRRCSARMNSAASSALAELGRRDDLDERHARAVEIDVRDRADVGVLAGVLLEVDALQLHALAPRRRRSGRGGRSRTAARRTARSGSPSAGPDRSSACARTATARGSATTVATPSRSASSSARAVEHRQRAGQPEHERIGERVGRRAERDRRRRERLRSAVASWTWTSSPITGSHVSSSCARPLGHARRLPAGRRSPSPTAASIAAAGAQQRRLVERLAEELRADRQAVAR